MDFFSLSAFCCLSLKNSQKNDSGAGKHSIGWEEIHAVTPTRGIDTGRGTIEAICKQSTIILAHHLFNVGINTGTFI